jgi:hypothetical protein
MIGMIPRLLNCRCGIVIALEIYERSAYGPVCGIESPGDPMGALASVGASKYQVAISDFSTKVEFTEKLSTGDYPHEPSAFLDVAASRGASESGQVSVRGRGGNFERMVV